MAPTAVAAWLIGGKTIESALSIDMNRYGGTPELSADRRSQLTFLYEDVAMMFINEISMCGTNKFSAIHRRFVISLHINHF